MAHILFPGSYLWYGTCYMLGTGVDYTVVWNKRACRPWAAMMILRAVFAMHSAVYLFLIPEGRDRQTLASRTQIII